MPDGTASRAPACACGSGLSTLRCCALDPTLPTDPPSDCDALLARAAQAHRLGSAAAAHEICQLVLERAPTHADALRLLRRLCEQEGNEAATEALTRRLVLLDPNDVECVAALATILLRQGRLAEAELHARNAVRLAPENPVSHNLLGMILTEVQRLVQGEHHYRQVLALSPRRDPILLANLAWNLKSQGRMAEARALYEESAALAPAERQTLLGWARLEEADRRFDAAETVLSRADQLHPNDPDLLLTRAIVLKRRGRYEDALALLDRIASGSPGVMPPPGVLLERGALLDRMGHYDEAFAAFAEAKRQALDAGAPVYLEAEAAQLVAGLAGFFTARRLGILPRARPASGCVTPIFILGFPRSGTTLVEQSLSAHEQIAAGDELPLVHDIADALPRLFTSPLPYPAALAELWMAEHQDGLDRLRDLYLHRAAALGIAGPPGTWFTDKMPLNETHLGLIALMFPEAPLLHVIRHPLDVVLSAFSNNLTHGFCCAAALETTARHYMRIFELVCHYRREMVLRYLPVRYEDFVRAPERTLRRMLDFIGVGFDAACLHAHENPRYARTASYAQVTEPLYGRAVFRYRNYVRHLEPVVPILRPAIEALGYECP